MHSFDSRVESLWSNPRNVDLGSPFIYFIRVVDDHEVEFRYVGKARNLSRLREYQRNMLKIRSGRERGAKQNYRAVHLALYSALQNNWQIEFIALENANPETIDRVEAQRAADLNCNLNGGSTWRVANMSSLKVQDLVR